MKRVATALVLLPIFVYLVLWAPFWAFLAALCGTLVCSGAFEPAISERATGCKDIKDWDRQRAE
ncbi:hypothetical protein B4Q13_14985 [Lacticaseibacillus rhamnosus]